ncbi:MAG: NADP-dependent oxidoreductase [Sandarakinorhabdus sp.]|nr:NADP-dependent oxidoreductase [Sandarakinorhabdus sp.]
MTTMMTAVRIHGFGGPETLIVEQVAIPEPAAGELLVRIAATSINPVDFKSREGKFPPISQAKLPVVLGRDFAGKVAVAAGDFKVGDEVYGMPDIDHGTYADYIVVRPEMVAAKPNSLDMVAAGAVPLAALTAWQGLFRHGGLAAGHNVLIHGAAGGVGIFAVQFAHASGARVFATGSKADLQFLRDIGADTAIDYKAERFEDTAHDIDLVLDLIGGETLERSYGVLKAGGTIMSTVAVPDVARFKAAADRPGMRYMTEPSGADLAAIGAMIDAGKVRVVIAERFPLDHVAQAQARLEQGGIRGKIAVLVA